MPNSCVRAPLACMANPKSATAPKKATRIICEVCPWPCCERCKRCLLAHQPPPCFWLRNDDPGPALLPAHDASWCALSLRQSLVLLEFRSNAKRKLSLAFAKAFDDLVLWQNVTRQRCW